MQSPFRFILLFGVLNGAAAYLLAQDTRNVTEPVFPPTCTVYHALLQSTADGPTVGPSVTEQNNESYDTTVANGDQEIAIGTNNMPTSNITVNHFR
jgi:hypothetical protein